MTQVRLCYIEESHTGPEFDEAEKFLAWCHANGRTFGHGNILQIHDDFKRAVGQ
jgi:hypothetical protein